MHGKGPIPQDGTAAESLAPHGYTGHAHHTRSGLWLAPYRAYSSALGRWISRDPIAEDGGINLYGYVGNDPLHLLDPSGLAATGMGQGAIDFGRGFGDTVSLGASAWLRDKIWGEQGCVLAPMAYLGGEIAGTAHDIALGSAMGKRAAKAAKALAEKTAREAAERAGRNLNVYENFFEAPIAGASRAAHRRSANRQLANALSQNSDLAASFNREFGTDVLQHMQSGRELLNPPGTVWHHPIDNPNVMHLLRRGEHTNPALQPVLHPNGVGGFGSFYGP